jgi:hypothetical protein
MYKSTTDQGKAINLFNLDFVRLQEIQYCLLRPYLAQKTDKVKTQRLAKVIN